MEDLHWHAYRYVKKKYMHTSQSNDCWQFFRLYCCNFKCIHCKFSHGTCSLLQDAALCTQQTLHCHLAVCWQKQNYTSDMQKNVLSTWFVKMKPQYVYTRGDKQYENCKYEERYWTNLRVWMFNMLHDTCACVSVVVRDWEELIYPVKLSNVSFFRYL